MKSIEEDAPPQDPEDLIFYLPIDQTLVQRELVEIMVKLHRPSILKILGKLKVESGAPLYPVEGSFVDDSVMLEAFVSNVKQIGNHPTLLVNHFIPKNLLLLDTKENIINSSLKYVKLDELLNRLTERKQPKTIIISVSNGKELDLVESILIGKNGMQYYRFSGASIYYKNHGSFDFSKKTHVSDNEDSETIDSHDDNFESKSSTPSSHSFGKSRKRKVRGSYEKDKSAHIRGGHRGNGRGGNNSNGKHKASDDYTPRISKNSPLYQKIQAEKHNSKLSVYLILSNQLKYLTQFEELKSDLIITLDSNLKQVTPKKLQVPILKLIITNSLEYFDQQLQREVPTLRASPEIYNKFLAYLTVAYRSTVNTSDNNSPVGENLIDWMMDVRHRPFPDDLRIPRFPVASLRIEDLASQCEESMENIQFEKPYDVKKYKFYDIGLNSEHKEQNGHKKPKLEELEVPAVMSYRKYQILLAQMVYERCKELGNAITKKKESLAVIHTDDSKRQFTMESNNAEIGIMYKKLRSDKTSNESMSKQLDRLTGDLSKLKGILEQLQNRTSEYEKKAQSGTSDEDVKLKENALNDLNEQLEGLRVGLKKNNNTDEALRAQYQSKSSEAARLSTESGLLDKKIEGLNKESGGLFKRLEERQVDYEIEDMQRKVDDLNRDNNFLESYIDHLDVALKKRQRSGPQSLRKTSRSGTPL
ncbi:hypothetical protein FOA43_003750 [Brettanomyces nanus]|uniref:Uncharacterized protein n=1 Tax=Eeniella nana TaxID=13502 RepID=A0A875S921_EENNA|nr:uncharacterized protein FOA43_003750 [Brettanomyces nanus]QPG76362.1 hypothetical protein FOA43_003750 [Brettanomyces nanus]